MATTRINGVKIDLSKCSPEELNNLLDMAAGRIALAQSDIEKIRNEQSQRGQRMLRLVR